MTWAANTNPLAIEFWMIRKGPEWLKKQGRSLFFHYREAQHLLWPTDDDHRWSDLALTTITENEITVLMGCGDSNKTYSMARYILIDWWAFPDETLWLISSTEYRGAELRIWGKIKELFNRAKDRYDDLPGQVLESMHAITTEEIDDDQSRARSLQKGLILVPCKKGNQYVGLSAFVGVKSPRLRHAGDEVQHMATGFLDAYANWYGKRDFKGVMAGNPTDPSDPLCTAGEPLDGWDNFKDTEKTQTWRSKFFDAAVIAFDGRDSPNCDFDQTNGPKFPYLVSRKKLDAVEKTFGKDSWQYFNQCVGKPNPGLITSRVITRQLCEDHMAHEEVIWEDGTLTSIYALDPAYGGGDRCVGGKIDFGRAVDGRDVICVYPPEIVPVSLKLKKSADDQIAEHVQQRLSDLGIPIENSFWDSLGKGTLGNAFARIFGHITPNPVDFGQQPTARPVRFDLFVEEERNGQKIRRLKRCDEHYSKFVTELWFSVREVIEGNQMRQLPKNVMEEGCLRIYQIVKGNRIEVEPKEDMKERISRSPDLFDWLAIAIEGARQRGFKITRLGSDKPNTRSRQSRFSKESQDWSKLLRSRQLAA